MYACAEHAIWGVDVSDLCFSQTRSGSHAHTGVRGGAGSGGGRKAEGEPRAPGSAEGAVSDNNGKQVAEEDSREIFPRYLGNAEYVHHEFSGGETTRRHSGRGCAAGGLGVEGVEGVEGSSGEKGVCGGVESESDGLEEVQSVYPFE